MGFFEAVKTCFRKYATFSGRARRREYWYFALFYTISSLPLAVWCWIEAFKFIQQVTMGKAPFPEIFEMSSVWLPFIIFSLYALVIAIPALAVIVRRLHDIGKSGYWFWIGLIPWAGPIILLVFMLTDSQPGENIYGPNPKEHPESVGDSRGDGRGALL